MQREKIWKEVKSRMENSFFLKDEANALREN